MSKEPKTRDKNGGGAGSRTLRLGIDQHGATTTQPAETVGQTSPHEPLLVTPRDVSQSLLSPGNAHLTPTTMWTSPDGATHFGSHPPAPAKCTQCGRRGNRMGKAGVLCRRCLVAELAAPVGL